MIVPFPGLIYDLHILRTRNYMVFLVSMQCVKKVLSAEVLSSSVKLFNL